ncbi:MAG: hypothetical protein ABIJ00_04900 [Candidatus Eisenbacteria bacterium]
MKARASDLRSRDAEAVVVAFFLLMEGLDRGEIASRLQVTPRTVRRYRRGDLPSAATLQRMSETVDEARMAVKDRERFVDEVLESRRVQEATSRTIQTDSDVQTERAGWVTVLMSQINRAFEEFASSTTGGRKGAFRATAHFSTLLDMALSLIDDPVTFAQLEPDDRSLVLASIAPVAVHAGRYDKNLTLCEQAIQYCNKGRPIYKRLLNNKAAALARLSKFEEADRVLREALRIDPRYLNALYNGLCMASSSRNKDLIEEWTKKIMRQVPDLYKNEANMLIEDLRVDRSLVFFRSTPWFEMLRATIEDRDKREGRQNG